MASSSHFPQDPPPGRSLAATDRPVRWLLDLCSCDTTTGREDAGLEALLPILEELGATVERQPVAPGRSNVLALWGRPRVVFSTHLDTVPPYLPPRLEADRVAGRGSCDAKGQAVAQLAAVAELLAEGCNEVAWLGVVDEEAASAGARAALELAPHLAATEVLIDGEPTDLALASGQRGFLHLRLITRGRPAHSGTPEAGHDALWPLLDWLAALRREPLRRHPDLGPETWNAGLLSAGTAVNVVPDRAAAELALRTVPGSRFAERVEELRPPRGEIEEVARSPWLELPAIPGFPRRPVPFGSDAVHLRPLVPSGQVVLAGPGSIAVAHTEGEHLTFADLAAGIDLDRRLALHFLGARP